MRKLENSELNRLNVEEYKNTDKTPIIVVLDNIRSMNNVGSVFRTADAFRIESIYLCGITATPPNNEIHKAALGATESVDWKYFPTTYDAVMFLKNDGFKVFAIEQATESILLNNYYPDTNKISIIFGNEIKGVDNNIMEIIDGCIEIPQFGTKHSLNISVTTGIVLWDIFNKLEIKFNKIS